MLTHLINEIIKNSTSEKLLNTLCSNIKNSLFIERFMSTINYEKYSELLNDIDKINANKDIVLNILCKKEEYLLKFFKENKINMSGFYNIHLNKNVNNNTFEENKMEQKEKTI